MLPKITDEQRTALRTHTHGHPVRVEDDRDRSIYLLVAPEDVPALWSDYIRTEVEKGLDAIEQGDVVEWNPEAIKNRLREANARDSQGR